MLTTVYFATNRALEGPATDWTSYTANIVAPSDPGAITYATAFVDNTDLTADKTGAIEKIENVSTGRFSQSVMDDLSHPPRGVQSRMVCRIARCGGRHDCRRIQLALARQAHFLSAALGGLPEGPDHGRAIRSALNELFR